MRKKDVFLAVMVTLLWGSSFVATKVGVNEIPPFLFTALRFIVGALPVIFYIGKTKVPWKVVVPVGLFLGVCTYGLLSLGVHIGVNASLSSLLLQSQVLFTILLSVLLLKDKLTIPQVIGICTAFLGIIVLTMDKLGGATFVGTLLILLAGLFWGFSNIIIKRAQNINTFQLVLWMSVMPPLPLLALSFIFETDQTTILLHLTPSAIISLIYVGLVSTTLAFAIWSTLLQRHSPSFVSSFALLIPVFGMISGAIFLSESLSPAELIGAAIVLLGLFLMMFLPKLARGGKKV